MYLWCFICNKVNDSVEWNVDKFKYGVCPTCGCSAFRNAIKWESVYKPNGYDPEPVKGVVYSMGQMFDI